jgi:hypothetical protein
MGDDDMTARYVKSQQSTKIMIKSKVVMVVVEVMGMILSLGVLGVVKKNRAF